ncbi:MAG: DUF6056 family protein [Chitinophagales bacterium]
MLIKLLPKINQVIIILILALGYILLFSGAYYSHPNAEDIALASGPRHIGLIDSAMLLLTSYDGRYSANIIHGLNPLSFGWVSGYKYAISFSILFFVSSFCFFLKAFFYKAKTEKVGLLSALLCLISWAYTSSLPHQLYWLVSSYIYLYAWCFWFLWVGVFLKYIHAQKEFNKKIYFFIGNLLMFVDIGINEMFLPLNLFTALALLYYDKRKNGVSFLQNLSVIINVSLGIFLFISSPGIIDRFHGLGLEPESVSVIYSLKQSLGAYLKVFIQILKNPSVLSMTGLLALGFFELRWKHSSIKSTFFAGFLILAILYSMTLPYFLTIHSAEIGFPSRIFTVITSGLILFLPLVLGLYLTSNINIKVFLARHKTILSFVLLSLIFVDLFYTVNNLNILKKELLNGTITAYNQEMETRFKLLKEVSKKDICWQKAIVEPLKHQPKSIYYPPDITPNRSNNIWNLVYESYFEIAEVQLKGDTLNKLSLLKKNTLFTNDD